MRKIKQFKISELFEIDGNRVEFAADAELKRVAEDIQDRPGDKRPRKVTIEMEFKPVLDEDGMCESMKSQVQVKSSVPTRKSKIYDFGLRSNGVITYHPDAPEDMEQELLDFDGGES